MNNTQFVVRNLVRGIIWLAAILILYIFVQRYVNIDFFKWLKPLFEKKILVFSIFLCSEIVIGIIPPEVFMLWALRFDSLNQYILIIAALSIMSYLAGIVGYLIGWYLNYTLYYRYLRRRFLNKIEERLNAFGLYLIIVAALTPVPFSGVAMLVGSVRYSYRKYLIFSLFRFIRFAIYAWIFWEARLVV
jgi:membrane protein DedA with SNARE-associated domain